MEIEEFVRKSIGNWRSMRSGHSLAFNQFEEIISNLRINVLPKASPEIKNLLSGSKYQEADLASPFIINWEAESNWEGNSKNTKGSSIIAPIKIGNGEGIMLRSSGYSEDIKVKTSYKFTNDGTLLLTTNYTKTKAEERIWFISENVRCRSSVISSLDSNAILQTSFASEIRRLNV
tara:strand:+ start:1670 stop:2197 length:528 start_codon:yes stop_codon:yes gene_type:complete